MTGNVVGTSGKGGIQITTNNVTLDLNGFALQGLPGSGGGIDIHTAQTNITVRNGAISGWGFTGMETDSGDSSLYSCNIVCERLNISSNQFGIYLNGTGVVRDCNCLNNALGGIDCEDGGIISGCTANNNSGGGGIYMGGGTVSGCTTDNNGYEGIVAINSSVSGCTVCQNSASGIQVDGGAAIRNTCILNNTLNSSSEAGISVYGNNSRIEDNQVSTSGYAGIAVYSGAANCIIIKNTVSGNGANNYLVPGSQVVGPLITTTGTISSTSPWANFSY